LVRGSNLTSFTKLGKFDENFKFETVLDKLSNLDLAPIGDKNKKIKF